MPIRVKYLNPMKMIYYRAKNVIYWIFILLLINGLYKSSHAQNLYRLYLTDKNQTRLSIQQANKFLSIRAIERRTKNNIPITIEDIPIPDIYLNQIKTLGANIICSSKWMNTVVVEVKDSSIINSMKSLPFIDRIILVKTSDWTEKQISRDKFLVNQSYTEILDSLAYGLAFTQLAIHNGQFLHEQGYTGKNILIAVIDAGFKRANEYITLRKVFAENRIVDVKDFVYPETDIFQIGSHGAMVLSVMAASDKDLMIGTSPDALYLLLRSEDINAEYPAEEDFWVAAAEYADSLGADIINTSLGYTQFDNEAFNYGYSDMNGKNAFISLAAQKAAEKGILVVVSAGNERAKPWHFIGAPADARDVLTVGAIKANKDITTFTSSGPTADGRIKPEVVAMGENVLTETVPSIIDQVNGTSFSAPIISGLSACLLQAFPKTPAWKLRLSIISSSNHFHLPDSIYGFGIPDFQSAFQILLQNHSNIEFFSIYPNPFSSKLILQFLNPDGDDIEIDCYHISGKLMFHLRTQQTNFYDLSRFVTQISTGFYIFYIKSKRNTYIYKALKVQ